MGVRSGARFAAMAIIVNFETVILAQARTHITATESSSSKAHGCMPWVPAFAGMTVLSVTVQTIHRNEIVKFEGSRLHAMGPGLRRDDGSWVIDIND
jgi:hypothetical protein